MNSLFLRLTQGSKREAARIGRLKIVEIDYVLEYVSEKKANVYRYLEEKLLPDDDFISLKEASSRYSLSTTLLSRLCKDGIVESKKSKGKWFINYRSLQKYIKK